MTSTAANSGRRRITTKAYTAEDQALDQIAREAEAKLAAKRASRSEAREIRMKELEKQQRENEEKQDRLYELTNDLPKNTMRHANSRRGSDDSSEEGTREIKSQLNELEDKYKKAMVGSAQLHNEKQALVYEVDLLKDQLEEQEEEVIEYQRQFKDKCKELESKKRSYQDLDTECKTAKYQLEQRDKIIRENGMVIIISDEGVWSLVKASSPNGPLTAGIPTLDIVDSKLSHDVDSSLDSVVYDSALSLTESSHDLNSDDRMSKSRMSIDSSAGYTAKPHGSTRDLSSSGRRNSLVSNGQRSIFSRDSSPKSGILDRRASQRSIYSPEPLSRGQAFRSRETSIDPRSGENAAILEENKLLKEEVKKLTQNLEEERSKKNVDNHQMIEANGPEMQLYEIQREASKQIHEYKLKLQKAEQDIATLEGSVNRLDSQVRRYKSDAEDSEKLEDELKQEKRKLVRELREAQSQIEELRNHNSHLQKRLEKMKQSRNLVK
ncbi:leucine-rich repeat flightless-interacting protein 2 isoform X1 [Octopus sinensis]|uniref:Leucine-rich repeat flightless-interacting protein 2 isoform X1 n=2 Tax=Octopus sinensis TaxID=2607531 RepID=A0A6P7SUI4_9MOLL|nr:leucine-rich repeat flightless-interacting protein 2 isoform X1 [Octopus sinensis]